MHKDSIGLFAKSSHNFSFFKSEAGGDDSAAHLMSIIVSFQNRIVVNSTHPEVQDFGLLPTLGQRSDT